MNKILFTFLTILIITGCNFTQKITDGPTAVERKQYKVSIDLLQKEYNKSKSRVEKGKIAFLMGESNKNINKNKQSIGWYLTAYKNSYGVDALKEYAFALKRNEQYTEAMVAFKDLGIEIGSPYEYRREITACKQAKNWKEEGNNATFTIQLANFNTSNADYSPTLYQDNQLVFTSDRSNSLGDETYNWTGNNFSDLFIVNTKSNEVEAFKEPINSSNNEGTVSFNNNFTEMYFTRCFNDDKKADNYCSIMMSRYEGGSWTVPIKIKLFEGDNVNYGDPSISADGNTLYFSANHPEGWGGHDIYMAKRTPEGWGNPRLMPRTINTIGNERFPFIDKDTLYFSSDYLTGMGGLDIFRTYKLNPTTWSPAHNLKGPINSGNDDFGFVIDYNAQKDKTILQKGYFTSKREDGLGNDDIYIFEKRLPPPPPPIDTTVPIVYQMLLDVYVLEKIYKIPDDPNSPVLGRKPLADATLEIVFGNKNKTFKIDEEGLATLELEEEMDYDFFASKENYLKNSEKFSSKGIGKDPNNPILKFEIEIVLDKIYRNKEITLENIYYDFDKWDIRKDAQPTLNKLAATLLQNPEIRIELASHTDCRGNARYNEDLSQKRAQSAVNYLISKGVSADRLRAKGYGENQLSIDCACARCTEKEHQANRRTTFKIIE
jgi:outer membrane protein OmpA-like peptidoglycan-associated protein